MKRLAEKGNEDGVAVKIITIVTLVYLPANAVAVGPNSITYRLSNVQVLNKILGLLFHPVCSTAVEV